MASATHGGTGHILVQRNLLRVVDRIDQAADRGGLGDHLALGQQAQGQAPPLADGDEAVAGLRAVGPKLRLDHRHLQHALGLDTGRPRLDLGLGVRHLAHVARRLLELVERIDTLLATLDASGRNGVAVSVHVCLLGAWGFRRKRRA